MESRSDTLRTTASIGMLAMVVMLAWEIPIVAQSETSADSARRELAYFVGAWKTDGEMRATLQGPFGPFASLDQGRWMTGNQFVVVEAQSTSANGQQFQLSVLGYDPTRHVYTFRSFNGRGIETAATGRLDGARWTWESAAPSPFQIRHVITIVSPTEYTFEFDMSNAGGPWVTFARGTAVKTK